jgi:hypothetical protein
MPVICGQQRPSPRGERASVRHPATVTGFGKPGKPTLRLHYGE